MKIHSSTLLAAVLASPLASAYYLPGIAPRNYERGKEIPMVANSLTSTVTEIPYDFYHSSLKFPGKANAKDKHEGLGAVLKGDRLVSTEFKPFMLEDKQCVYLGVADLNEDDATFLIHRINEAYTFNFELDDLPATSNVSTGTGVETIVGVFMGSPEKSEQVEAQVFNHFLLNIEYHQVEAKSSIFQSNSEKEKDEKKDESFRVVGFSIVPSSHAYVDDQLAGSEACRQLESRQVLKPGTATKIHYYYSVKFTPSEKEWMHRWDEILVTGRQNIHWFNIAHSLIIVIFLMAMVAMILLRALHRDISRYNSLDAQEDAQEEFGWKLVHADVFRTPVRFHVLSVLLGNGAQIFLMGSVTLIFAMLGFMSPANRGSLLTGMVVSYVLSGFLAGYVSAIFYKMFGGESWKKNVLATAFGVPGVFFLIFVFLNFFLVGAGSSAAVPFTTMLALIAMWFLVSVPLCFLGAYRAFKRPRIEHPVRTNQIPRQIPEQPFYMRTVPSVLMGGILPFGAIFVELFFILNSIWSHQFYYVFGFLFIIGCILVMTCATVAILMCYFQLCAENYKWWWRAFFTSGSSAFYVFLNSIVFYYKRSGKGTAATFFIYFGWSFVMSALFFLVTGFIGFMACWIFVRKIYASIKID